MTNAKAIEAIKMIKDAMQFNIPVLDRHYSEAFDLAIKALEGQKTGAWIIHDHGTTWWYKCSKCGMAGDQSDRFCKHCGAKMEVVHE